MNGLPAFNPHVFPHAARAYGGPPGNVPFARMLEAENRVRRVEPIDTFERTRPSPNPTEPSPALLPKLGELLPIEPEPEARLTISEQRQLTLPATGRVLDLVI
ncbi:MAG: hypothetical protein KC996_02995 [Phycisphaerales bacterium]|nr:hypothetical protein [Phycisphaerales bacterium]